MASAFLNGTRRGSRVLNRRYDVVVRAAAADISTHPVPDLLGRARVPLCDTSDTGHDLAGRAIATLKRVSLDEGRLQGVELLASSKSLDGRNLATVHEGGERKAGLHPFAVD